ncbi:DNA-processing protein DprA [Microbacterium hydrocarbonoxydans]|uniref:DNA-processing protein DprA n=1 Tax=Microbacterium hydrocarbonoxydans TaxID=273678 RepID=UPI0013DB8ACB|nr:DNA-processing protein DprA [Microbacterium hydrocarbonoxydans]
MMEELLADPEVIAAMRRLRGDGPADIAEVIARVAWSVVAEPGDGVAGALITELGAAEAMRFAFGGAARSAPAQPGGRALKEALARWRPRAAPRAVREAMSGADEVGASLLLPGDAGWPAAVDDLGPHAPSLLWVRGDAGLLTATPRVAIVGARAASGYGELLASEFAGDLAATGAVIVSGGAYGIDGAAHRAALSVQGATVAFLAGGVDRAYPQGHRQLLHRIAERGAVVSEVPCGAAPTKWRFLSRNRLIAALSDATVVVEAGWRSGSLNTAGHAAALGRPLGAVPGPVTSATSAGCHRLLREYDARCVTTTAEIRELWAGDQHAPAGEQGADPDQLRLLDALSTRTGLPAQEIARRSGLAPDTVSALLGLLELDGVVQRGDTGWRRVSARERLG